MREETLTHDPDMARRLRLITIHAATSTSLGSAIVASQQPRGHRVTVEGPRLGKTAEMEKRIEADRRAGRKVHVLRRHAAPKAR